MTDNGGRKKGRSGRKTAPRSTRGRTRHETSAGGVVFRTVGGEPRFLLIQDSYGNWGFPKGHLERGERADTAALREVMEETGLRTVAVIGPIAKIDWFFRFRGALIHKQCEFFLMESPSGDTKPQQSEGITACDWVGMDVALERIGYENARGVLRRAHEMVASRAPGRAN